MLSDVHEPRTVLFVITVQVGGSWGEVFEDGRGIQRQLRRIELRAGNADLDLLSHVRLLDP